MAPLLSILHVERVGEGEGREGMEKRGRRAGQGITRGRRGDEGGKPGVYVCMIAIHKYDGKPSASISCEPNAEMR